MAIQNGEATIKNKMVTLYQNHIFMYTYINTTYVHSLWCNSHLNLMSHNRSPVVYKCVFSVHTTTTTTSNKNNNHYEMRGGFSLFFPYRFALKSWLKTGSIYISIGYDVENEQMWNGLSLNAGASTFQRNTLPHFSITDYKMKRGLFLIISDSSTIGAG